MGGYFVDTARALWTTAKNLVRPPTTVRYPRVVRERAPRFRASFALLHDEHGEELCIGCLQCERICPSQVITVTRGKKRESPATGKKRGWADDLTLDLNACIFCELCVQVCPVDAIVMVRAPEAPGFSREENFLSMDRLYQNETLRESAWATGSLLMEMQDPKRGQPKPVKKPAAKAPADRPTAKAPADKPADGPTAKAPEEKPDEKPEEKPEEKPADEPAAKAPEEKPAAKVSPTSEESR
jgi:NADH-quinone oxidoreductase subunit I